MFPSTASIGWPRKSCHCRSSWFARNPSRPTVSKSLKKQLKQQEEKKHTRDHKGDAEIIELETPAQTKARYHASMKLQFQEARYLLAGHCSSASGLRCHCERASDRRR
ncbi:hypothetical protein BHM03_00031948 [Ensete ventricosum]|nr:hypothetical protein BHM03_00031948 [Ensete ventricosum]